MKSDSLCVIFIHNGGKKMELAAKLLTTAGILMLLAGVLFGVTQQWLYAALICIGAFGCLAGAMNFRNWKKIVKESETIK